MSACTVDYPCLYCGKETSLYDHFVYERIPVQSLDTGQIYLTTVVHPCVYKYEEDNQLQRITEKDQAYARSISETYRIESEAKSAFQKKKKRAKKSI